MKNIVFIVALTFSLALWAQPVKIGSKAELAEAKAAVAELVDTGISAKELIKAAEDCTNGSERYYLYLAAFRLQAKDKKYDQAAETLKSIREEVIGAPLAEIVAMIEKSLGKNLKEATAIQPLYRTFRAMSQAERQIVRIRKELKEKPKNAAALRVQLGEALAVTGDWDGALKSFAKGTGDVAEIAKAELSEPTATIASFWWDYEPRMKGTEAFFKAHAASIYQGLLEQDALSGVQKLTAEKRIAAAEELGVEESSDKPKNELAALKKICNTKGLVHCWRFNGNLKDCVSGNSIKQKEAPGMLGKKTVVPDSEKGMVLGRDVLPQPCKEFTIELWSTQIDILPPSWGGCVILSGGISSVYQGWNCGSREDKYSAESVIRWAGGRSFSRNIHGITPFDLNVEYHISIVFEYVDNVPVVTYRKQNSQTGKTLSICKVVPGKRDWTPEELGEATLTIGGGVNASYNEVRIWNRALSEEELTQNAIKFYKAGETMKK